MDKLLIGPFKQIVTFRNLPENGPIDDEQLEIIPEGGILIAEGKIKKVAPFPSLQSHNVKIDPVTTPSVAIPGFIDAHTHICFAGNRVNDYALRIKGSSYAEILKSGGGIYETVAKTQAKTSEELAALMMPRLKRMLKNGITTAEVKSGYGLSFDAEIKMLEAISQASLKQPIDLIPTCLAAHAIPKEFSSPKEYLQMILNKILPEIKKKHLTKRVDIFVEKETFPNKDAKTFLLEAKKLGFDLVIHGDQFHRGGAKLAAEVGALSCDHLEMSLPEDFAALKKSNVIPVVLPGASLGLGIPFPPARKLLDAGLALAIASDWNPGSAPFGYLLALASFLAAAEKLTVAETLAGITARAARALNLSDRGVIDIGKRADILSFDCSDFREIVYWQGGIKPKHIWIQGILRQ